MRPIVCCICGSHGIAESRTTPDPEAPEMLQLPPGWWVGFVIGDHAPEMIVCCSDACTDILFRA